MGILILLGASCFVKVETIKHLFLDRELTSHFLCIFFNRCGLSWCILISLNDLVEAWRMEPFHCWFNDVVHTICNNLIYSIREEREDIEEHIIFY